MIKGLWCRFKQCLGTFTILFLEATFETGLFDIYLTTFSESLISKIQNLWGSSFYSKCLHFNLDVKNAANYKEKVFCFWYNCIWIGIVKFSLFRIEYFSSAANMLTSSPKVFHINKRYFLQLNWLGSDQSLW